MGNTINVQGSYIDIHDNQTVNLNVSGADVRVDKVNHVTRDDDAPAMPTADEVARAIEGVMVFFSVKTQWVAIYRVLVDFFGWPHEMKAFCYRVATLQFNNHLSFACDYQAIQKGKLGILDRPYDEWVEYEREGRGDVIFNRQKFVADKMMEALEGALASRGDGACATSA